MVKSEKKKSEKSISDISDETKCFESVPELQQLTVFATKITASTDSIWEMDFATALHRQLEW